MSKRFYWLKLKDDFFDSEKIKIVESMENGKDYIIFLLKLQVKSIRNIGHLRLNADIPYSEQMLSTITNTNIDIVRSAIKLFQQIGLLQILDDGTYYMTKVAELTGSEVDSAERVRQHRIRIEQDRIQPQALQCNNDVTKCNTDIEIELEREKDLKKEKEKEEDPDVLNLVQELYDLIMSNANPTAYRNNPPDLIKWYKDMERLHRIDGIPYNKIRAVMIWATKDNFWMSNILSASKLREKFPTLEAQMKRPSGKSWERKQPSVDEMKEYLEKTGDNK